MSDSPDSVAPYSDDWWRITLSSIGDAVIVTDTGGRVTYMNPVAQKLTGWSIEEASSRPLEEVFPIINELSREAIENPVQEVLNTGAVVEMANHTVLLARTGREVPIDDSAAPIRNEQGDISGVVLVFRDITEKERSDMERAYLAAIVESSDDAIVGKTLDGIITSWNKSAERIFGYTAAEAIGQTIYIIVPPERHEEEAEILAQLRRGERIDHFETARVRKDGQLLDVSVTISPIKDASGRIIGASKVARDISEKRRAEKERESLLERERAARAEAEAAWQRYAFLTRVNEILSSTLDYDATLKSLACLVVPQFADWCAVDIIMPDGAIRRVAVTHQDPAKVQMAEEISRRFPEDPDSPYGVAEVLRSGEPSFYPEITDERLAERALNAEHLEMLRALGLKSAIIVPLVARGRTLGAITFANGDSGRGYTQQDFSFAQDLARHAALSVDNARLYQRSEAALRDREEAVELHRSVEERLGMLVEASNKILGTMQLGDVELAVLEISGRLIAADAYAIWRKKPNDDTWRIATAIGLSEPFRELALRLSELALTSLEKPLVVESVHDVSWLERRRDAYALDGIESFLAIPLRLHGEFTSTITFYYRKPHRFTRTEVRVATALANLAAAAIGTAELYQEQSQLRARAEEANRLKDEFLATVSHELRTPLNAMFGWLRMLRSGRLDEATAARALEVIDRNAQAQAQIVDDILDMSRIITGKLRLDLQPVALPAIIEAAVDTIRPTAEAKEIGLQVLLDQSAGPVLGDPNRLQQVVWNLLSNSVKFTPRGGRVSVNLVRIKSHVEISVADTGQGISPEFLPHVFDRFRQADSSTTRSHGGLGLGLAIVRNLVELHGGMVRAESEGEGKGATFIVRLPLAALRDVGERVPSQREAMAAGAGDGGWGMASVPDMKGVRVLAVDDEADARELLMAVLGQCGAEVKTAASSTEGLELVREWKPHVIISDIGMPDENGYLFIRRVRALPPEQGGDTPAAALTAYARMEDRLQALNAGYQTHVAKPVDPTELVTVVASLAGRTGRG